MLLVPFFALFTAPVGDAPPYSELQVPAAPTRLENRATIYLGQRSLDETDYEPVEKQTTFGIDFFHQAADANFGFEFGIMGSSEDGSFAGFDVEGSTFEVSGGVRRVFGEEALHPYVGGGLAYINSEVKVVGVGSADDSSLGAYLHGGVTFDVSRSVSIGLDLRLLLGSDLDLAGYSTDADYAQIALTVGFGF